MKFSSLLSGSFCLLFSLNAAAFMGGEHVFIGNKVVLKNIDPSFRLLNGAQLNYGQLIAMGDLYGVENAPISQGSTPIEREQRFVAAYNTMDLSIQAQQEIPQMINFLNQEYQAVQNAITKNIPAHQAYRDISLNTARQMNCLTGGGCDPATWWMHFGRSMRLASTDFDHFGKAAWLSYEAGHHMAMRIAVIARNTGDISYLYRAYAMNAFASHFLMDRYATGHMRTPRLAFYEQITPTSVGNLLMRYMHSEENAGLNVHNAAGQHWRAMGDGYDFESQAVTQEQFVLTALQHSADEIDHAYQTGQIIEDQQEQLQLLPVPDEENGACDKDVAQMFIWNEAAKQFLRRETLQNKHACKWTSNWWGWSTLIELKNMGEGDLSIVDQAQLARTIYAKDAVNAGLITNKRIIEFIQRGR